jgi:intein-encoded DNA endonuclease-like protein
MGYRSYSYEEYLRAMELLKDHGPTEVCRILGWPITRKSTLSGWKNGKHKPPAARWGPKPSSELAYIIGVLNGDGNTVKEHTHHYDIELKVKDIDFAIEFSKTLSKLLDRKYVKPKWSKVHNRWRITYSSVSFWTWYKEQTLETLKLYIEHDKKTVAYFLRGLYDSEGYNYRCEQIWLSNNNTGLLCYVQYLLERYLDITATGPYLVTRAGTIHTTKNGGKVKSNHNTYSIEISRKQHIQIFLSEVGFSIKEKQLGLPRRT